MLDGPETSIEVTDQTESGRSASKVYRSKPVPFERAATLARQRREEAQARREAIEASQQQRQQKLEERERYRKAMAKARRTGPDGQRKLGRESKVLLEKVKKIVRE